MKKIKLAYSALHNAGDLMNVDIVERLSGRKVARSKTFCAEMTAIGGALIGLQYAEKTTQRMCQHVLSIIYGNKPIYVWGSGFLHDYNTRNFYRNNLKVCALRGKKTQQKLKDLTGNYYDVPLADAGLLVGMLMEQQPEKQYKIGLIPHMWHQNEASVVEMAAREDVHLINIKRTPQEVAYDIAQCETIASTSLHGLVFADALHIPNMHVIGDRELRGGNFKYEDYYSAFNVKDNACVLSEHIPTYEEIIDCYQIDWGLVEEKKKALVECFPKI